MSELKKGKARHLHDLILRQASRMLGAFHGVAAGVQVFDEGETERTATVLVTCELGWRMKVSTTDSIPSIRPLLYCNAKDGTESTYK